MLDGSRRQEELVGNFGVGETLVEELENFGLTGGETGVVTSGFPPLAPGHRHSLVTQTLPMFGGDRSRPQRFEDFEGFQLSGLVAVHQGQGSFVGNPFCLPDGRGLDAFTLDDQSVRFGDPLGCSRQLAEFPQPEGEVPAGPGVFEMQAFESHQSQAHPHEWEVRRDDDSYISIQDMEETWGTWDESVKEMDRRHAEGE